MHAEYKTQFFAITNTKIPEKWVEPTAEVDRYINEMSRLGWDFVQLTHSYEYPRMTVIVVLRKL